MIDNWSDHSEEARSVNYVMEAGKSYDIKMEYYQNLGGAVARLGLAKPSEDKIPGVEALVEKATRDHCLSAIRSYRNRKDLTVPR